MAGMMTGLLLLLLAGVTVGRVVDLQKRIFGGKKCDDDKRLYHVKLIDGKGELECGGSLIHKDWILTSGHCVDEGKVKAVLGVHPGGTNTKTFDIEQVEIYEKDTVKQDIALLKVKAPQTGYETVNLPQCDKRPLKVQIAGHAATGRNDANKDKYGDSKTLQCAETTLVKCALPSCSLAETGFYSDPEKRLCYKNAGEGIHEGDSGGGVVFNGMIYGVIDSYCQTEDEVIDVCGYKNWIEGFTGPIFP